MEVAPYGEGRVWPTVDGRTPFEVGLYGSAASQSPLRRTHSRRRRRTDRDREWGTIRPPPFEGTTGQTAPTTAVAAALDPSSDRPHNSRRSPHSFAAPPQRSAGQGWAPKAAVHIPFPFVLTTSQNVTVATPTTAAAQNALLTTVDNRERRRCAVERAPNGAPTVGMHSHQRHVRFSRKCS